jgi:hypothetical protein
VSLNLTKLLSLHHLIVGLFAVSLDKLPQIVEVDLASLITEAEHECVENVGLSCAVRANDGGEVKQGADIDLTL